MKPAQRSALAIVAAGALSLLACTAAVAQTTAPAAAALPLLHLTIKPSQVDPANGTAMIDVVETISGVKTPAGQVLLSHLDGAPGMSGSLLVTDLTATDDTGTVPLVDGRKEGRVWTSTRDVEGTLTLRYRRPIDNATGGSISTIPHVDGQGVFGIANMLFILPVAPSRFHLTIDWDLSAMPAGSSAVTNFGDGTHVDVPSVALSRLAFGMAMAGLIHREPDPPKGAFEASWTGEPTFDVRAAMKWTSDLHHWMSRFWGDPVERPYHVFVRAHAGGVGVAATQAFALGYSPRTTADSVQYLLGHEMTHTWTAADIGKWFSEGNAVYYQTLLPWRAGMMSTDKRLEDINITATRYFASDVIGAPDSDILPKFWTDQRYNVLPYDRGAIYFAVLDGKIRRKSGGKRSLDDAIRQIVAMNRDEQDVTEQTWIDILRKELGDEGPAIHRAMISGKTMVPESGDYGPCFRRIEAKIGRLDLGFGPPDVRDLKTVTDLRPDSNAAKAGLKTGDKIVAYVTTTTMSQKDPKQPLTLKVERDGKTFEVSYLPRGALRDIYQWERVPGAPEGACK